jgi:hypothetical protein
MDRAVERRVIAYTPLPSQARFHRSEARFKGFSGPIGSGKSQALCQEAIRLAYVNAGRTGLIGAPTYPMLRDATQASLLQVLEENRIPFELNKAEQVLTFRETGSRVLFRAIEEFDRLRGTNLAWFGVDELTYAPEEAWLRLEGRLRDPRAMRLCGFAVWTPKGHDWVWRRFVQQKVDGYEVVLARPHENRHILNRIPDFYERLKSSYDERFYEQEVLGEYVNSRDGLVYFAFDRLRHVARVEVVRGKPLLWALDFNVTPMSSVVAQMESGTIRVLDEIVLRRATTEQACAEFLARYGEMAAGLVIYGDASGSRMQTTGSSDYEIVKRAMARAGVHDYQYRVPRANPAVRDRVSLLNSLMANAAGESALTVDPRCKELIRDFEEVEYKAGSSQIDKERDPNRTHLSDALGYLAWQEHRSRRGPGERSEQLF